MVIFLGGDDFFLPLRHSAKVRLGFFIRFVLFRRCHTLYGGGGTMFASLRPATHGSECLSTLLVMAGNGLYPIYTHSATLVHSQEASGGHIALTNPFEESPSTEEDRTPVYLAGTGHD